MFAGRQLVSENNHVRGGLDPQSHLVAGHAHDRQHDRVAQPDPFVFSSGQHEHEATSLLRETCMEGPFGGEGPPGNGVPAAAPPTGEGVAVD